MIQFVKLSKSRSNVLLIPAPPAAAVEPGKTVVLWG